MNLACRVFLDANVLFSAAYLPDSGLRRLWLLKGVELLSSSYAVEEARGNLSEDRPEALGRFDELVKSMKLVGEAQDQDLPNSVRIDAKDKELRFPSPCFSRSLSLSVQGEGARG